MAPAFVTLLLALLIAAEVGAQQASPTRVAGGADADADEVQCDPPCKNGGHCNLSDDGTRFCQCPGEFSDKDCSNSFLDVICGATQVKAMLRQEFLQQHKVPATSVVLGGLTSEGKNSSCFGTFHEVKSSSRGYYSMSETHGRRNCGAATESNATHLILSYQVVVGNRSGVIERTYFIIKFTCVYPREQRAWSDVPLESRILSFAIPEMKGMLQVLMALYKSESFSAADQLAGAPTLTAFQRVYVRVYLVMSRDQRPANVTGYFSLLAVNCWSTPSSNASDHLNHKIVNDGCPADHTAYFHGGNGNDTAVDFSFQMFKFIGIEYSHIYMHCAVRVCYSSNRTDCVPGCQGGRVKRQSKADIFEGMLSIGPMKIVDEERDLVDTSMNGLPMPIMVPVFLITAIGGALAALCCFAITRRGWRIGRHEKTQEGDSSMDQAPTSEPPSPVVVSPEHRDSTTELVSKRKSLHLCIIS